MYETKNIEIRDLKLIKKLETEMSPFRDKKHILKSNFNNSNLNTINSNKFSFGIHKDEIQENKFDEFILNKAKLNLKKENKI